MTIPSIPDGFLPPPHGHRYVYDEAGIRGWLVRHIGRSTAEHWEQFLDQAFVHAYITYAPYVILEEPW